MLASWLPCARLPTACRMPAHCVTQGLEEAAAAMGWDGLRGQKLCMVSSYYAADGLVSEYGIVPVKLARQAQAAAAVQAGDCFAFVGDAGERALWGSCQYRCWAAAQPGPALPAWLAGHVQPCTGNAGCWRRCQWLCRACLFRPRKRPCPAMHAHVHCPCLGLLQAPWD